MELLDDQRDLQKTKEERLMKRRKLFRPLNLLFPLLYIILASLMLPNLKEKPSEPIYGFIGTYAIIGLLGWMIGKALTLFILKDVSSSVRSKYLVSLSTLVLSSLALLLAVLGFAGSLMYGRI